MKSWNLSATRGRELQCAGCTEWVEMALDADALAALADFGKGLPGGAEVEDGKEGEFFSSLRNWDSYRGNQCYCLGCASGNLPPAWESFPSDLEVVAALLAAVSAETGEKQESLLPQTNLIDDLDFDDLSLYAVVAQLEAELKEKRSDAQIVECETLGELALLYGSSKNRANK